MKNVECDQKEWRQRIHPEDLMYPIIEINSPYVSECMVDAISELYDGLKSSEVECQS